MRRLSGFQEIYQQHSKSVYRFLLSLTGDATQAEELLQETFYQAFLHIGQFRGRSSLYTWLCQIGKYAWLKECRRGRRLVPDGWELLAQQPGAASPEAQVIRAEETTWVRQAVLHLEEPYKDVFILHVYGGVKLKEIAAAYGKSESWARVTYFRAKQRLIQEVSL